MSWINGNDGTARLMGRMQAIKTGKAQFPVDDPDLVAAAIKGLVEWNGTEWTVLTGMPWS